MLNDNNDNDGYFNYFFITDPLGKFYTMLDSKPKRIERPKNLPTLAKFRS
ncbi:hypothetical protein ENHYDAX1_240163 [Enhydrobacter sp. AX1]|nr:hypothetical protein ENHYDAX1_240163 [Enhydrobacter sp. AX1]